MVVNSLITFVCYALAVSLKCWQQLNVVGRKKHLIPIVSLLIAVSEVAVITRIVVEGWLVVIPAGLGGGVGCLAAIYIFDKANKTNAKK